MFSKASLSAPEFQTHYHGGLVLCHKLFKQLKKKKTCICILSGREGKMRDKHQHGQNFENNN